MNNQISHDMPTELQSLPLTGKRVHPIHDNVGFLEEAQSLVIKYIWRYQAIDLHNDFGILPTNDDIEFLESLNENGRMDVAQLTNQIQQHLANLEQASSANIPFWTLVDKYELDSFCQKTLLILFIYAFSAQIREILGEIAQKQTSDVLRGLNLNCGMILSLLFPGSLRDQMKNRPKFSLDSPLLKNNLVVLEEPDDDCGSMLDYSIHIAPRIAALIADDNHQYATTTFIDVLYPRDVLEKVIIPSDTKDRICQLAENHDIYSDLIRDTGLQDAIAYGRALTILEHGPSGTGKTAFARALANHLNKPLISLKPEVHSSHRYHEFGDFLSRLFLEANLRNGIIFLDECDQYLSDDDDAQCFLTEIEKAEGIIILATNKPNDLNESIDRRMMLKVRFEYPTQRQRMKIWKVLIPNNVELKDVDFEELATAFPFAGGYIKNAIVSAVQLAAPDAVDKRVLLTMKHLIEGAKMQEVAIGELTNRIGS